MLNIFPTAGIGRQADGGRNSVHRTEALILPAIADHACYEPKLPDAAQRSNWNFVPKATFNPKPPH